MASNQPGKCCAIGVKHEGIPQGKLEIVAGTETYVATPTKPKESAAIVFVSDIFGHQFQNNQLLADQFAANGYLTLVPDLFFGDAVPLRETGSYDIPENFNITKWFLGKAGGGEGPGHMLPRTEPVVKAAIKYLREEKGINKIGAVGYCYGAKFVVRALEHGAGIDVGYVAHPSYVENDELEKISGPLSIAAAETDSIFTTEQRHQSEVILQTSKQPYQINLYGGVEHGFAVRTDISRPLAKFAMEEAFYQAIRWFDQWLQ